MRIALDAMGGDNAPEEIIQGAVLAAPNIQGNIVLVGDPEAIARHLPESAPPNLDIHPATEVIGMDEKPIDAIRRKKNSSIVVAARLVKEGHAQAFVSAGNTGACTAASLLSWRQLPGVDRPAIASDFPNRHGRFLLLDAGASPDAKPENLVEFAKMGRAYAMSVMGRPDPAVYLLNIGEEAGKGNALAKQAFAKLSAYPWFAGNIEGKDMFRLPCDVVVCDAFVGNIVLKTAEGVAEFIMSEIKGAVPSGVGRLAYLPLKRVVGPLRKKMDYAETGGSPLLGLNGLCIICHGRSNAKAICNALLSAAKAINNDLVQTIRECFQTSR